MKKFISALLVAALALSLFTGCGKKEDTTTIYVYNWGQYIAEGDDDSIDVIAEFEKKYPNIKVQYSTFDSNETMYAKLKNGGITVDVVIPSDLYDRPDAPGGYAPGAELRQHPQCPVY